MEPSIRSGSPPTRSPRIHDRRCWVRSHRRRNCPAVTRIWFKDLSPRSTRRRQAIRKSDAEPVALGDPLAGVDAVSLYVRLSDETAGLMSSPKSAVMRSSAYLINTACGGLIDEDALVDALRNDEMAGQRLTSSERNHFRIVISLDNVVLTPHVAGSTQDAVLGGPRILASELETQFEGE